MSSIKIIAIFSMLLLALPFVSSAEVSKLIPVQGRLTDSAGLPLTGNYNIDFSLYKQSSGGVVLWTESWANLPITNGNFQAQLGSNNPLTSMNFDQDIWLEIKVNGEVMNQRQRLLPSPYALYANQAGGIPGINVNDGNFAINTPATSEYRLSVAGRVKTGDLTTNGDVGISGGVEVNGISYLKGFTYVGPKGDPSIMLYDTTGDIVAKGPVRAPQFCINATCITSWPSGGGGASQWTTSGNNIYYTNGNVGIGTTNPAQKLTVDDGRIAITGNNPVFQFLPDTGVNAIISQPYTGSNLTIENGDNIFFDTYSNGWGTRMTIAKSGSVGIGTASPQTALDVSGTIRSTKQTIPSSGAGTELIYNNGVGYVGAINRSSGNYQPMVVSGKTVTLFTGTVGGGARMTVDENGNVGIGTTNPSQKLTVDDGRIAITGNNTIIVMTPDAGTNSVISVNSGNLTTEVVDSIFFDTFRGGSGDGWNHRVTIANSGNVGILNGGNIILEPTSTTSGTAGALKLRYNYGSDVGAVTLDNGGAGSGLRINSPNGVTITSGGLSVQSGVANFEKGIQVKSTQGNTYCLKVDDTNYNPGYLIAAPGAC